MMALRRLTSRLIVDPNDVVWASLHKRTDGYLVQIATRNHGIVDDLVSSSKSASKALTRLIYRSGRDDEEHEAEAP